MTEFSRWSSWFLGKASSPAFKNLEAFLKFPSWISCFAVLMIRFFGVSLLSVKFLKSCVVVHPVNNMDASAMVNNLRWCIYLSMVFGCGSVFKGAVDCSIGGISPWGSIHKQPARRLDVWEPAGGTVTCKTIWTLNPRKYFLRIIFGRTSRCNRS